MKASHMLLTCTFAMDYLGPVLGPGAGTTKQQPAGDILMDMYFLLVQVTKIFGIGPRTVQEHMVDHFYK